MTERLRMNEKYHTAPLSLTIPVNIKFIRKSFHILKKRDKNLKRKTDNRLCANN